MLHSRSNDFLIMSAKRAALTALSVWAGLVLVCVVLAFAFSGTEWGLPPADSSGTKNWAVDDWREDQSETLRRGSFIREPENTWSNSAYLLAGLLVLFRARKPLPFAFGGQLCALSLTSGLYHASVLEPWQTLDIAGVYGALISLLAFCIDSMAKGFLGLPGRPVLVWSLVPATAGLALLMACLRTKFILFDSTIGFVIIVGVLLVLIVITFVVTHRRPGRHVDFIHGCGVVFDHVWVVTGFLLLAVGVGLLCRLGDGAGRFLSAPGSWLQAHAVWHVLSAAALLLTYELFARVAGDDQRVFCDADR